jgi:hypothetical protein
VALGAGFVEFVVNDNLQPRAIGVIEPKLGDT